MNPFCVTRNCIRPTYAKIQPIKTTSIRTARNMDAGTSCTANAWARVPATPSPTGKGRAQRAHQAPAERKAGGAGRALLRRCRPAGSGRRNRRLRFRLAGNGALRPRSSGQDAGRGRRRFMGETAKILSPEKTHPDARSGRDLFARSGLPGRRIRRILRCASGPHRGRVCQYQRGSEGARRLDGDVVDRPGHRRASACAGQENPVGAGQASGQLYPEKDRRRHAAVARLLPGA